MDVVGKGGNIKCIREKLDLIGYEVNGISVFMDVEFKYYYLWRFVKKMLKLGYIEIFDWSWYGCVLVECVEGFVS